FPAHPEPRGPGGYASGLGTTWLRAPLLGIVDALHGSISSGVVDALRIVIGVTATLILVAAVSTSISGAGRLACPPGQHGMVPVAALLGAPLTLAIWIAAMATHPAARIAGPIWMLLGAAVYVAVRRSRGEGLTEQVQAPVPDFHPAPEGDYQRILVPLKLGPI